MQQNEREMTTPQCVCVEDDLKMEIPHLKNHPEQRLPEKILDYGEVEVGTEKCLHLLVENKENRECHYTVKMESSINPIYQAFRVRTHKFSIAPLKSINVRVFYKPLFAMNKDVDYFDVVESNSGNCFAVQVQGTSHGPEVHISSVFLRFNAWPGRNVVKQTVELRNVSNYAARFCFDIDDNPNSSFRVDTMYGTIDPKKYVFITITYAPRGEFGDFSQRLYCLIDNHDPLYVDLYGLYAKKREDCKVSLVQYVDQCDGNYFRYMKDVQILLDGVPEFSLSQCYLDFGGPAIIEGKRGYQTLVSSLTNHTNKVIVVKWSLQDESFEISPQLIKVPENDSALFECDFVPTVEDMLFTRNIYGNVYLSDEQFSDELPVPMPITLRVIGHSFNENNFWIPLLEIEPEVAILPPSLPGASTFTTITLKSSGYLPVSFKFLPPKKTNFIVKPIIGIVHGCKMIVVQHQADAGIRSKVYVEKWCVLLNGHQTHKIPFYIKGFSESPSIVIGRNNKIVFKQVQVGCVETQDVVIRNVSHHHIMYEFLKESDEDEPEIEVKNPTGILSSGAKCRLKVAYNCTSKISKKKTLPCYVRPVRKLREVFGEPRVVNVEVFLESGISELCCIPSNFDFGTTICHSVYATNFQIHNLGCTTVHYLLIGQCDGDQDISDEVDLEPDCGTLRPKDSRLIYLKCHANDVGYKKIKIVYKIRRDSATRDTVNDSERLLFVCEMTAQYPNFQIVDIADHNFGPLFSKASLWETFNVNRWNLHLKNIKYMECLDVNIALPEVEYNDACYYVVFVLKNVSLFPAPVSLKRRKICECQLQEIDEFLSMRKKVYACPHRELFKLNVLKEQIEVNGVQYMKLEVNYKLEGNTKMSYYMQLSHARELVLNFDLMVIGRDSTWISKYHPTFDMKFIDVCLSEKDPFMQCFWLYNNTAKRAEYELNVGPFADLNKLYDFTVFECLNPKGVLDNYTSWPVLFRYVPIERRTIKVQVPMILGSTRVNLNITVTGTAEFKVVNIETPIVQARGDQTVNLSDYVVNFGHFPVWRSSSRLIFIQNVSEDIIAYSWQKTCIEGIVEAEVRHPKGILRPFETDAVMIKVKTAGMPCRTRVHLPCKLMNHTEYLAYKASIFAHEARQEQLKEEFIINESGVHYPENNVRILKCPRQMFLTLAIEVTVTSSEDVDLEYSVEEQLQLSPQSYLQWDKTYAFAKKDLATICDSLQIDEETSTDSINRNAIELPVDRTLKMNPTVDKQEFYSMVLECVIADSIFSQIFRELMNINKLHNPTYYSQIRSCDAVTRRQLIVDSYKEPDPSFVSELFQELFVDCVPGAFGLPAKDTSPVRYNEEVDTGISCQCYSETPAGILCETVDYFGE